MAILSSEFEYTDLSWDRELSVKRPNLENIAISMWGVPVLGKFLQDWRSRKYAADFEQAGMEAGQYVPADPARLRRATDAQLHAMLAGNIASPAERVALERERATRDARQAAKPANRISTLAFAVSVLTAAPSLYQWANGDDANERRCLAIQHDMLSAKPLRADGPMLFQALSCKPKGAGSVHAIRRPSAIRPTVSAPLD
jgi:hypothetical protein